MLFIVIADALSAYIPVVFELEPVILPAFVISELSLPYIPCELSPIIMFPSFLSDEPVPFPDIPIEVFPADILPLFRSLAPFIPYSPAELSPRGKRENSRPLV